MPESQWDDEAQAALNRMRRASLRGTGCHLTAEMIACLDLTAIGQLWHEDQPPPPDGRGQAAPDPSLQKPQRT